jgi:hypothetical protein
VGVSFDLRTIQGIFTPSNHVYLDAQDLDFGAGGVMLLPGSPFAVAAGKYDWDKGMNEGGMYVLDRTAIDPFGTSVFSKGNEIGYCACGPSYFHTGLSSTSGAGHIVSSGGATPIVWRVPPASANNGSSLLREASNFLSPPNEGSGTNTCPPPSASPGGGGFFTSISSTNNEDNAIIWAVNQVSRFIYACDPEATTNFSTLTKKCQDQSPSGFSCNEVWLYAFDASQVDNKLPQIFMAQAGFWDPSTLGKANIVPVVANGRVYVASWGQLDIFGFFLSGAQ